MIDLTRVVRGHTYTHDDVIALLGRSQGAIAISYGCDVLSNGVVKRQAVMPVDTGEVSCGMSDEIKLRARLVIKDDPMIDWYNDRLRPYMRLTLLDGADLIYPLGTYVITKKSGGRHREVECMDACVILQEDKLSERLYIPAGTKYVDAISSIILSAGITTAIIDASDATLQTDREDWDIEASKLEVCNQLLSEMGFCSLATGPNGLIVARRYAEPGDQPVSIEYREGLRSVVLPEPETGEDDYNIPNVFVGICTNPNYRETQGPTAYTYTYINDNPNSFLSTVRRGRRIVQVVRPSNIADQAALEAYVRRAAFDAMTIYSTADFATANMPHHEVGEIVGLSVGAAVGKYQETGWTMALKVGANMTHTARKVVTLV